MYKRQWMGACCLTPGEQFVSFINLSAIRWYNDAVFVLDQHAYLDCYSALCPQCRSIMLNGETANINFTFFSLNG